MRLGQKDGSARQSGRIRRTDPPALETDPPSTTNAYSGAAIRDYLVWFGLVWFGLVWFGFVWFFQTNSLRIAAPEYAFVVLGGSVRFSPTRADPSGRFRPEWWADPFFAPVSWLHWELGSTKGAIG